MKRIFAKQKPSAIAAAALLACALVMVCFISIKNRTAQKSYDAGFRAGESVTRRAQEETKEPWTSSVPTVSTTAEVIDTPYVGMWEYRVGQTLLGKPDEEVRHNFEIKGGERYEANLYDFTRGGRVVFTARCVDGRVTEIWDWRDEKYAATTWHKPKTTAATEYDRYDVYDYRNAEDFYDDHYDDFFDYYDAENYFRDHH